MMLEIILFFESSEIFITLHNHMKNRKINENENENGGFWLCYNCLDSYPKWHE